MSQRSQSSGKGSVLNFSNTTFQLARHRIAAAVAGVEALEPRRFLTVEQAGSADGFVDSIGINSHFSTAQTDNPYTKAATLTTLGDLGIRHLRDNPKNPAGDQRISTLYNSYGTRIDIAASNTNAGSIQNALQPYVTKAYTESAEGVNEPENFGRIVPDGSGHYSYGGVSDDYDTGNYAATRRYDDEYEKMVKANTSLPFISSAMGNPQNSPYMAGTSFDQIGLHAYPLASSPGDLWKLDSLYIPAARQMSTDPTTPIVVTEAGYQTSTEANTGRVSEDAKAKYLPRMLAEYFNRGIARTYMYEFADEHDNIADNEANYGLIKNDGTVKQSYTDIKNMISLLKEATWNTTTKQWDNKPTGFTPGSLDYTLSTSDPDIHHTLLQKANGEYDLLIWNETKFLTNADGTPKTQTVPVTLTFNTNIASAAAFSIASSATVPTQTWARPLSITLNVPDEVTVIRLAPGTIPVTTAAVGSPDIAGSASLSGSTYTITGSGTDIWNASDQFRFAYQTLTGDADIVTHVASFAGTQAYAKAGIMVRQSLSGSSVDAGLFVTPGAGAIFQTRQAGGMNSSFAHAGTTAPYWLKLSRKGNVFTAFTSATGADGSWTQLGTTYTGPMTGSVYVGLAVSSHDAATTATATFDNTTIVGPQVDGSAATPDATLVSSPVVSVTASDASAGEGGVSLATNAGQFTVTRSGPTGSPLTLSYTMSGSATSGSDYTALPGAITIPAGASSAVIPFNPLGDAAIEGIESAILTLGTGAGTRVASDGHAAEIKIADYAADLVITGVSLSNPNPVDGDSFTVTATVKNIGNAPVPAGRAMKVGFFMYSTGGYSMTGTSSAGLAAGASIPITSSAGKPGGQISMSAGRRQVLAFLDVSPSYEPADTLSEANIRNNEFVQPYTVAASSIADSFTGQGAGSLPNSNWMTTGDGWQVKTDGGQSFLENTTTGTGTRSISRSLGATAHDGSWALSFSQAWRGGGYPTEGHGQHSLKISADVLDSTNTGYRIRFYQGDSKTSTLDDSLISIFKVNNNVEDANPLASSTGFDAPGWSTLGHTRARLAQGAHHL